MSNYNTSSYNLGDVIPQSYHPPHYAPKVDGIDKFIMQKQEILQPPAPEAAIISMVQNMTVEPVEEIYKTGHHLDMTG